MSNGKRAQILELAKVERDNKTPYIYGGQTLGRALDCSGLVCAIWTRLGLRPSGFDSTAHALHFSLPAVRLDQLAGGDLAFFATDSQNAPWAGFHVHHVAIYSGADQWGRPYIIHASGGSSTCRSFAAAAIRRAFVKQTRLLGRKHLIGFGSIAPLLQP